MKPTEEKIQSNTSDLPVYLFKQGNNCEAYRYFGAHLETRVGESGVVFRVWAPHAVAISVVGDFNSWKPSHAQGGWRFRVGIVHSRHEGIRCL